MKVIITESQYKKILLEQSNVYTDKKKYNYALKTYNALWYLYNYYASVSEKTNSFNYKDNYKFLKNEELKKLIGITEFNPQMLNFLRRLNDKVMISAEHDGMNITFWCKRTNGIWETKTELKKWNMTREQQVKKVCPNAVDFHSTIYPVFPKPNILKPIFKKPEPPKPVQPTVTKPSIVQPPKPKPLLPPPTLDKTKPIDFYFGNRILRAPDYEIAKKFAEKLALRNFNSNQVFVYKDKNNEKWFIGANDKIYFSQDSYNQDPNKNVYLNPIEMGMVFI